MSYKNVFEPDQMFRVKSYLGQSQSTYCYNEIGFSIKRVHDIDWVCNDFPKPSAKAHLLKVNNTGFSVPSQLSHIATAIFESKELLALEEGWDGDDGEVISPDVLEAANLFLIKYAKYVLSNFGLAIKAPEINACGNGSIDMVWRTKKARLLINFKNKNNSTYFSYYGDLYNNKNSIKGSVNKDLATHDLANWMKNVA